MFEILRKLFPPKVSKHTVNFLISCLERIKDRRVALAVPQLEAGLLRFWRKDDSKGLIRFTYFPNVSSRFEDPLGKYFRINNIRVEDIDKRREAIVSIYFSRGLIMGFSIVGDDDFDPDLTTIDVANARIEILDTPEVELEKLLSQEDRRLINWSDVYEVELDGVTYYHLKDIGDGDFIAIDNSGGLFEIRHDPYQLKRLTGHLAEILT